MSGLSTSGTAPAEVLLDGFVGYLRSERGVTALTVEAYVSDVRRFLAHRGDSDVRGLTAAEVSNAVLGQVGGRAPATVRRFGCGLRSFLRYCYLVGLVDQDLSAAALPVSGRRRSLLPQGITPREAQLLLGACDRRRAIGRRDFAVIVLMLRLGLRATEVATLRLEDLDWRAGQLTVHGKGGPVDELPLPADGNNARLAAAGRRWRGGPAPAGPASVPVHGLPGADPACADWMGWAWSPWAPVSRARRPAAGTGLYRVRSTCHAGLVYAGQGAIAVRLRAHAVKDLAAGHRQGPGFSGGLEASWTALPGLPSVSLLEHENDLIAAHLLATGQPPAAQFLG